MRIHTHLKELEEDRFVSGRVKIEIASLFENGTLHKELRSEPFEETFGGKVYYVDRFSEFSEFAEAHYRHGLDIHLTYVEQATSFALLHLRTNEKGGDLCYVCQSVFRPFCESNTVWQGDKIAVIPPPSPYLGTRRIVRLMMKDRRERGDES